MFVIEGDVDHEQPDGEADDDDLEDAGEGQPEGAIRRGWEAWRIHGLDMAAEVKSHAKVN